MFALDSSGSMGHIISYRNQGVYSLSPKIVVSTLGRFLLRITDGLTITPEPELRMYVNTILFQIVLSLILSG